MVGDGAATLVARAFAAAGRTPPPDALARFLTIYAGRLLVHTRPYPGMREVLDTLVSRVPLAVLTNKPMASTRELSQGWSSRGIFPPIACLGAMGHGRANRTPRDCAPLLSGSASI